ncbi:Hypothetical predicted protein [Mytilus galloprovincialis]|uniref:G-protein coupled receptors family 1 profile domain-containing protein n=1 Tax=Mytilus galloprovincialis TaxID=29158 RepID=A0A8B6FJE6_MYTGA|nr:Hypothetical predicted protein [Mytilus galloprovincialis]
MKDQSVETMDESTIRRLTVFLCIYMLGIVISNAALKGLLFLRKNLRKISHLYIVALFCSELLDGLILTSSMLLDLNGGLDTTKCVGIRYAEEIALTFGIFTLIGIAVDRYRCIVYPQLYKPTFLSTIFVIAGLLIASFIFSLNVFIENIYIKMCNILIEDEDSDLWWRVYGFIVHFVLPLVVLIVLYFRIVKKLWMTEEVLSASTVMKRRTVKLTLICSAAYVMC